MDKTETYIKMCDCPEIQEQWHHGNCYCETRARIGDSVWFIPHREVRYIEPRKGKTFTF